MDANQIFKQYVADVGGRAKAAKRLGVSLGMVGHIEVERRGISINLAKRIEADTKGRISRYDLRPDVFGPAPKRQKARAA